jgi:hypothetical protein
VLPVQRGSVDVRVNRPGSTAGHRRPALGGPPPAEPQSGATPAANVVRVNWRVEGARRVLPSVVEVIGIVMDEETMTEEAWVMVDCLEAYFAREHAGLVYAPGDGVFDARLQPIHRRPPK